MQYNNKAQGIAILVLAFFSFSISVAEGQIFPNKTINFVLPSGAGSTTDLLSRQIGAVILEKTGQTVLIQNRPGAEGIVGTQYVKAAAPDGYTVLVAANSQMVFNVFLQKTLSYDPTKDFSPVTGLIKFPLVLVVGSQSKFKNAASLFEAAKVMPEAVSYGYFSSAQRLANELLQQQTGAKFLRVPFRDASALIDLQEGRVDFILSDATTVQPFLQSGKLKALAVTSPVRTSNLPDVPTINEAALKGYEFEAWLGTWVPAGTPGPVITRLNELIGESMKDKRVMDLLATGSNTPFVTAPGEFAKFQASETERFGKVIREANIEQQ